MPGGVTDGLFGGGRSNRDSVAIGSDNGVEERFVCEHGWAFQGLVIGVKVFGSSGGHDEVVPPSGTGLAWCFLVFVAVDATEMSGVLKSPPTCNEGNRAIRVQRV